MNITDIILAIENNPSPTERCISYAEVIVHLKHIRNDYAFPNFPADWKNDINDQLRNDQNKLIDAQIVELKLLIDSNIKY